MMDLVLKLRELRRMRGLHQRDVAQLSGIGEKSISSFETGERLASMKVSQLMRLLSVYGVSPAEFFGDEIEKKVAPWDIDMQRREKELIKELSSLPSGVRETLVGKFLLMIETAADVHQLGERHVPVERPRHEHEWQMMTSRN